MALDPATRTIIGAALRAVPIEMGENLIRSAYSSIIREARDASTALLDPSGRIVSQAQLIPIHMNSFGLAFQGMVAEHAPETFEPGDAVITNDPYKGGQHLNDIILFTPIFSRTGKLVAFCGSIGHHIDIGGGAAGPNAKATDVQAEGLCLSMLKIKLERDLAPDGLVGRVVRSNVRAPGLVMGDLAAQVAANETGAVRLLSLHSKYGEGAVSEAMQEIMDYSERLMSKAIAELPDGTYTGEDVVDNDGFSEQPYRVSAKVAVSGGRIEVDLTASSPEAKGPINVPLACTYSSVYGALAAVMGGARIPVNDGCYRPVDIVVGDRSLLNPSPGLPVRARMLAVSRVFDAIIRALSTAAPERVIASGFNSMTGVGLSHRDPGGHRVYLEVLGGGYGAGPGNDGADVVDVAMANCSNIPIEAIEKDYPFMRMREQELIPDSGGPGRTRGGMGMRRAYEILRDSAELAAYSDRLEHQPWGLEGGLDGKGMRFYVDRDGEQIDLPSKVNFIFREGDILYVETGGGGGYGPPAERPEQLVERDLKAGRISLAAAHAVYGYTGNVGKSETAKELMA